MVGRGHLALHAGTPRRDEELARETTLIEQRRSSVREQRGLDLIGRIANRQSKAALNGPNRDGPHS